MSLVNLKCILNELRSCSCLSLQILHIKNNKTSGTVYNSRELEIKPEGSLKELLNEIVDRYTNDKNGKLFDFTDVTQYDGSTNEKVIYKLGIQDDLIKEDYLKFTSSLSNPDCECDAMKFNQRAQAYVIKGVITHDGENKDIKLVVLRNPITVLKHKFYWSNGKFKKMDNKVISLTTGIDVLIFDDNVYMMTGAAEKLFNIERSYKLHCAGKLEKIKQADMIYDFDGFEKIAGGGHNPRKFLAFRDSSFDKLKDLNFRRNIAERFRIPLCGDKFDTSETKNADKLIKLLCKKGMIDPFNESPMEVDGSKTWK